MNIDYKNLLKQYDALQKENKKLIDTGVHDYNLINALLKKNDEVHLHSNFIYSMINPESDHYCGSVFLKLFLDTIGESDFIDHTVAKVHKEKGKIDLLIEDGEHVIIIENKLRAKDQYQQIVRYLYQIIDKYFKEDKTNLKDKIHIVYLSEYKTKPSSDSKSIDGFELENGKNLLWQNELVKLSNEKKLELPKNTKLPFKRLQHSQELKQWCESAKEWIGKNKPDNHYRQKLLFAFDEYLMILKRLDETRRKEWRNIMALDEYMLGLKDDEQENMYAFMCEANEKLNEYLGKKLYREVDTLIPVHSRRQFINKNGTKFKDFTENNCITWFKQKKKSKYKDVGFQFEVSGENYFLGLGVDNIALGSVDKGWKNQIITNRTNIQRNKSKKNLFHVIDQIKAIVRGSA